MNYSDKIDVYEERYSMSSLYNMYKEGRINFIIQNNQGAEFTLAKLLDTVRLGLPLPVVYVSELQNGDFFLMEDCECLSLLLRFINDEFSMQKEKDIYSGPQNLSISDIPLHRFSQLMRSNVVVQIIDYRTPRYLHMQAGLLLLNWSENTEQRVRDELYSADEIKDLRYMKNRIKRVLQRFGWYRGKTEYICEYETLYMLAVWFVYCSNLRNNMHGDMPYAKYSFYKNTNEQLLLDMTLAELGKNNYDLYVLLDIVNDLKNGNIYGNNYNRRKRARTSSKKIRALEAGIFVIKFDAGMSMEDDMMELQQGIIADYAYLLNNMSFTGENIHMLLEDALTK